MPPVRSRTTSRSVPSMRSRLSGLASSRASKGLTGRRLANRPRPSRRPSSPCSGRGRLGSVVSHFGPPTAPRRTASAARQPAKVSSGSGDPVASIAAPPIEYSENVKSPSAWSTSTAEATTSRPIPSPGRRAIVALMAAGSLASGLPGATAAAQGLDQTCALTLTKTAPATVNVAYPDDSAQYYSGAYQLAPGTHIRIHGRFPHARYMSFNVYDAAQRPLDGVSDIRIAPDAGSGNPFVFGAERRVEKRDSTVFIDTGSKPEKPAPNTIYTGTGQNGAPNTSGTFIYRIYIPDKGRDDTGGVGLPTVTVESSDGEGDDVSPCANVEKPKPSGVNEAVAGQALPGRPSSP